MERCTVCNGFHRLVITQLTKEDSQTSIVDENSSVLLTQGAIPSYAEARRLGAEMLKHACTINLLKDRDRRIAIHKDLLTTLNDSIHAVEIDLDYGHS